MHPVHGTTDELNPVQVGNMAGTGGAMREQSCAGAGLTDGESAIRVTDSREGATSDQAAGDFERSLSVSPVGRNIDNRAGLREEVLLPRHDERSGPLINAWRRRVLVAAHQHHRALRDLAAGQVGG